MENQPVKFGFNQIASKTPEWAKWTFRIFFYCTSMTGIALTTFTRVPAETKVMILEGVTFGNLAIHSLSKMCGVTDAPPTDG